jgi:gas vesicle protein
MKSSLSFFVGAILGAAVGAIVALLFAPSSGEELRARINQEAQAEREKLQAEYESARDQVKQRVETVRHQQEVDGQPEAAETPAVEV